MWVVRNNATRLRSFFVQQQETPWRILEAPGGRVRWFAFLRSAQKAADRANTDAAAEAAKGDLSRRGRDRAPVR